jgi:hypothetical protein
MDKKNVRFIRKNGRIIPIKIRNDDRLVAGASITTGTALAVGGGAYSGHLFAKARKLRREGWIGARNMMSSESRLPNLKDFRLKEVDGKIKGMGGSPRNIKGQMDMFEQSAQAGADKFEYGKRVKAYKSAFRSRQFLKFTRYGASGLIGLGVERAVTASGIEKKNNSYLKDFTSEVAGIGTSAFVHSVSGNVFDKIGKGIPLKAGFKSDILKGLSALSKIAGKAVIKRKMGIK